LARYPCLFIGGGNTFSLLKQVRELGFGRLLVKYNTKGLQVFGGSAGAKILGRDIEAAYFGGDADKNEVGLKVLKGLDVARGYSIARHRNGLKYDHFAAEYSERTGIPILALGDSTGIQVKNHEILVIGLSSANVFDGEKSSIFRKGAVLG
jgi:dipeptidase E